MRYLPMLLPLVIVAFVFALTELDLVAGRKFEIFMEFGIAHLEGCGGEDKVCGLVMGIIEEGATKEFPPKFPFNFVGLFPALEEDEEDEVDLVDKVPVTMLLLLVLEEAAVVLTAVLVAFNFTVVRFGILKEAEGDVLMAI